MKGSGVQLLPRHKLDMHDVPSKGRAPVLVQRETIYALFGRPQVEAVQKLGITLTKLK